MFDVAFFAMFSAHCETRFYNVHIFNEELHVTKLNISKKTKQYDRMYIYYTFVDNLPLTTDQYLKSLLMFMEQNLGIYSLFIFQFLFI